MKALLPAAGLACLVTAVVLLAREDGGGRGAPAASPVTATAQVVRRDLAETDEVEGTLGFDDERGVSPALRGTVTWVASEGTVVRPGRRLFEIDGRDVVLLDGTTPAYRELGPRAEGRDVRQLERNLVGLGFGALDADGTWTAATTAAVKRFQAAHGMAEDGRIDLGRIVFLPGARRVAEVESPVGSVPREAVLTTTSTRRVVGVELEPGELRLARRGARVRVELPDGRTVRGRITEVGRVARRVTPEDPVTIPLEIVLRRAPRSLDQAPVDVELERRRARGVLAVPVTALLARAGGEFALEVREAAGRRLVAVETGVYADGLVEVRGAGLREGLRVTNAEV